MAGAKLPVVKCQMPEYGPYVFSVLRPRTLQKKVVLGCNRAGHEGRTTAVSFSIRLDIKVSYAICRLYSDASDTLPHVSVVDTGTSGVLFGGASNVGIPGGSSITVNVLGFE
jgi:hypothetical protein